MALTLRRRKIVPMPRRDFDPPVGRGADPFDRPSDDYLVEGDELPVRPSAVTQIAQFLQVILIVVLGVLSLAVFWLMGLLLNVF